MTSEGEVASSCQVSVRARKSGEWVVIRSEMKNDLLFIDLIFNKVIDNLFMWFLLGKLALRL